MDPGIDVCWPLRPGSWCWMTPGAPIDLPDLQPLRRSLRRRLLRLLGAFLLLQAFVAWLVVKRAKYVRAEQERRRPPDYRWRRFDEVQIEESGELVQLYMHGAELLDDMVHAIDLARDHVYVETYIWIDDVAGRCLRDALARASARGVEVFVIYDALLSSSRLADGFFHPETRHFAFRPLRVAASTLHPSTMIRDHRKIVTVDSEVGFVGGYNFGDEYSAWRDSHLRVTGETALEIENTFVDFWNAHRPAHEAPMEHGGARSWNPQLLVHRNDPTLGIFPIRGMYMEAIDRAKERIWITNAYFVPDRAFRGTLREAAQRGVDVRVLLPARSNHAMADALAHRQFDELLSAGVRIFLYRDFMVHAKTATIDGAWTTVGTANLDRWSMLGNYEINVEVHSQDVARQMEAMFEFDLENAHEVLLEEWRRRPFRMYVAERTLRSLAPLM